VSVAQIPPPVDTTWVNDAQAATDAATILRLASSGADYDRLLELAGAAGELICLYLDRTDPIPGVLPQTPPPPLRTAHANVTVELWRRKDAPFGVLDAWSPDGTATRIGSDPLQGVHHMITPYKAGWGIG